MLHINPCESVSNPLKKQKFIQVILRCASLASHNHHQKVPTFQKNNLLLSIIVETETCFEGTLQTKVWKHRGFNNTLDRQCGNCRNIIRERFISIKLGIFTIISLLFHIFFLSTFIKFFL